MRLPLLAFVACSFAAAGCGSSGAAGDRARTEAAARAAQQVGDVIRFRPGVSSALDRSAISDGRDVGAVSVSEGGRPAAFTEPFWFAAAAFRPDVKVVR